MAQATSRRARRSGAPRPAEPGVRAGQNCGVSVTSAPYVLLLNPDATPDPIGIAEGIARLDAAESVGAVQGVIVNRAFGEPERSAGRELGPVHLLARALGACGTPGNRLVRSVGRRIGIVADHVERVPRCRRRCRRWLRPRSWSVARRSTRSVDSTSPSSCTGRTLTSAVACAVEGGSWSALSCRFASHGGGGSAASLHRARALPGGGARCASPRCGGPRARGGRPSPLPRSWPWADGRVSRCSPRGRGGHCCSSRSGTAVDREARLGRRRSCGPASQTAWERTATGR